jgi:uncharacterized protein (DUF58 family)
VRPWPGRWPELRPRHTLRPTRDGWWCLGTAVGLGIAAINTGNNLLYLLVSMLLGLIVVSGLLSEQTLRGLHLLVAPAEDLHAGRPALLRASVTNTKRWLTSYSVVVEIEGVDAQRHNAYVTMLPAGAEQAIAWHETLPARGRQRLPELRVGTAFPFGLFWKSGRSVPGPEVVVFPALRPVSAATPHRNGGDGEQPSRRLGHGHELYNLREYVVGDDPRLIHWRSSAKAPSPIVRELEAPTQLDSRIVLVGTGVRDPGRLEAALSEAASLAVELLRAGAAVELVGPGFTVPAGVGRVHERRILTALALYDAEEAVRAGTRHRPSSARLRDLRVALG